MLVVIPLLITCVGVGILLYAVIRYIQQWKRKKRQSSFNSGARTATHFSLSPMQQNVSIQQQGTQVQAAMENEPRSGVIAHEAPPSYEEASQFVQVQVGTEQTETPPSYGPTERGNSDSTSL